VACPHGEELRPGFPVAEKALEVKSLGQRHGYRHVAPIGVRRDFAVDGHERGERRYDAVIQSERDDLRPH